MSVKGREGLGDGRLEDRRWEIRGFHNLLPNMLQFTKVFHPDCPFDFHGIFKKQLIPCPLSGGGKRGVQSLNLCRSKIWGIQAHQLPPFHFQKRKCQAQSFFKDNHVNIPEKNSVEGSVQINEFYLICLHRCHFQLLGCLICSWEARRLCCGAELIVQQTLKDTSFSRTF